MGIITQGFAPEAPDLPIAEWDDVLNLWQFSDSAYEVTTFFQNLFARLPSFFLAFFALSFFFIVVPLMINFIKEML